MGGGACGEVDIRPLQGKVKPGGWKKLAVVDESYGHLERSDLHEKMRELSKKRGKSVE